MLAFVIAVVCWISIYFGINSDWYMWAIAIISSFVSLMSILGGGGGSKGGGGFFDGAWGGDDGCGGGGGGGGGGD